MQLFVKTLTGKTIVVEIETSDIVYQVKWLISDKEEQRLIHRGKEMDDDSPVSDYIRNSNDAEVTLCLRLRYNEFEICRLEDHCKPYRFYCHLCGSEEHDTEKHNNNSTKSTSTSQISNTISENDNNDTSFPITITIMGHQSSQFNIDINLSMTVLSLKEKTIHELKQGNLSTENLTLIHHGTIMQDKDLLGKYYITPKKYNELFLAFCFNKTVFIVKCSVCMCDYPVGTHNCMETITFNNGNEINTRMILNEKEYKLITESRDKEEKELKRIQDELEAKKKREEEERIKELTSYRLCYMRFGLFGTDKVKSKFLKFIKDEYLHFYYSEYHPNEFGCSGPWTDYVRGRKLEEINQKVNLNFYPSGDPNDEDGVNRVLDMILNILIQVMRTIPSYIILYDDNDNEAEFLSSLQDAYLTPHPVNPQTLSSSCAVVELVFAIGLNNDSSNNSNFDNNVENDNNNVNSNNSNDSLEKKVHLKKEKVDSVLDFISSSTFHNHRRLSHIVNTRMSMLPIVGSFKVNEVLPPRVSIFHVNNVQLEDLSYVLDSLMISILKIQEIKKNEFNFPSDIITGGIWGNYWTFGQGEKKEELEDIYNKNIIPQYEKYILSFIKNKDNWFNSWKYVEGLYLLRFSLTEMINLPKELFHYLVYLIVSISKLRVVNWKLVF